MRKDCLWNVIGADESSCSCQGCHRRRLDDDNGAGILYCKACNLPAGEWDRTWPGTGFRLYQPAYTGGGVLRPIKGQRPTYCQCRYADATPGGSYAWQRGQTTVGFRLETLPPGVLGPPAIVTANIANPDIPGPAILTWRDTVALRVEQARPTGMERVWLDSVSLPATRPAVWSDAHEQVDEQGMGAARGERRLESTPPTAPSYLDPDTGRRRSYTAKPEEAKRQPLTGPGGAPYRRPGALIPGARYSLASLAAGKPVRLDSDPSGRPTGQPSGQNAPERP